MASRSNSRVLLGRENELLLPKDGGHAQDSPSPKDAGQGDQEGGTTTCMHRLQEDLQGLWNSFQIFWNHVRFVVVRACFFFYLDVFFDISNIVIYLSSGIIDFTILNILAIMASNAYAFLEMRRSPPPKEAEDPAVLITAGYLAPFSLQMAYLTYISWSEEKKHRLMECTKLAEATLEASISSLLSTYALAHHEIPETVVIPQLKITQEMVVWLSLLYSFYTMGSTLVGFDYKDPGLDHLPGTADLVLVPDQSWYSWLTQALKYPMLLAVRTAEVASRITSIALFSACTRDVINVDFADQWPEPWKYVTKNFFLTLGPSLVLCDFCVLLLWILFNRRDHLKAFLSVLCCMNPLLEKGNPFSIKVECYFGFRFIELLLMIFAVWYLPDDPQQVHHILWGNRWLCILFVVSTIICAFLLCTIRLNSDFAHHALLNSTILEQWSRMREDRFQAAPLRLLKDLKRWADSDDAQRKPLQEAVTSAFQKELEGKRTASLENLRRKYANLKICMCTNLQKWFLEQLNDRLKGQAIREDQLGKLIGQSEGVLEDMPTEEGLAEIHLQVMLDLGLKYLDVKGLKEETDTSDFPDILRRINDLLKVHFEEPDEAALKKLNMLRDRQALKHSNMYQLLALWSEVLKYDKGQQLYVSDNYVLHFQAMAKFFDANAESKKWEAKKFLMLGSFADKALKILKLKSSLEDKASKVQVNPEFADKKNVQELPFPKLQSIRSEAINMFKNKRANVEKLASEIAGLPSKNVEPTKEQKKQLDETCRFLKRHDWAGIALAHKELLQVKQASIERKAAQEKAKEADGKDDEIMKLTKKLEEEKKRGRMQRAKNRNLKKWIRSHQNSVDSDMSGSETPDSNTSGSEMSDSDTSGNEMSDSDTLGNNEIPDWDDNDPDISSDESDNRPKSEGL